MKNFRLQLIPENRRVAVALSGGSDSMALLCYLAEHAAQGNYALCAVNVDHGIRGARSRSDSAFVREACERLGVPLRAFCVDAPARAKERGETEEEAARALRYGCFRRAVEEGFCDCVATAHHRADNAETALFRFLRGTGPRGLAGIPETAEGGRIVRPMLEVPKAEICEYLRRRSIPYVEDDSNADTRYARNALRLTVVPAIARLFPEWEEGATRLARIAREDEEYFVARARAHVAEEGGDCVVTACEPPVFRRACRLALERSGCAKDAEKSHYDALWDLLSGETGRRVHLPHGVTAVSEYGSVRLLRARGREDYEIPFSEIRARLSGREAEVRFPAGRAVFAKICGGAEKGLYFDLDKLPECAIIRPRRAGDRFRPFGGGDRKLKEYLIDKKIPRTKREDYPVIAAGSRVYAVLGLEISDDVRVDENTRAAVRAILYAKEKQGDAQGRGAHTDQQ